MNRVAKACCGDCAKCALLANGEVDMIPCILDQILHRIIRLERIIDGRPETLAAECEPIKKNKNVQEDD